jgi:cell division septation protein DedD
MEEQTTWKGHSLTLLVFTGIVVLCSIFFILGTLVGRVQAQKVGSNGAPAHATKIDAKPAVEDKPDFTFYEAVKKEAPATLQPAAESPAKVDPKPQAVPETPAKLENLVNYQIGAVRKSADAEKLLNQLKKKGFRSFILAPSSTDRNPFFRVQVGPFADPAEAQNVKKKLESAGYQPILRK